MPDDDEGEYIIYNAGMTGKPDLYAGAALHRAVCDVNEGGTEAAAATGVVMQLRGIAGVPKPPPEFHCDRPFMFLIRSRPKSQSQSDSDAASSLIYFMGRYVKPPTPTSA